MNNGLDPAGVAAFLAAVCAVSAVACGSPELWGFRRLALGGCAASSAIVALILAPSPWWWGAVAWAVHQWYLGGSFILRRRRSTNERTEYLHASVSVLAYVALADGQITAREADIIKGAYARAGFSSADVAEVATIVRACEGTFYSDGSDPNRLFKLLQASCAIVQLHSNGTTRVSFFRTAVLIAASDGFVSPGENQALQAAAQWLGLADDDAQRVWSSVVDERDQKTAKERTDSTQTDSEASNAEEPVAPPDLATYYASILGVSLTVSPQELRRAYREKAKRYHPDVVAHKGPTFAREAEERFKELAKAYRFFLGQTIAT